MGIFCRRILFKHTLMTLLKLHNRIKEIERLKEEEGKEEMLSHTDPPNIKYEDNSIDLAKSFYECM